MTTGKFISIEGIEGAGKTTQVMLLNAALTEAAVDVVVTREPGGSPAAEDLRDLFIRHEWDGAAEAFLLMAGRRDHVMNVIRPALEAGCWVVSDRFSLTTFAYQGYGRGVSLGLLRDMDRLATRREVFMDHGLMTDLTIVLDVPAKVGLERARARSNPDRMESLSPQFFERVRSGFLDLAESHHNQCAIVDAGRSQEEVHEMIKWIVRDRLGVEFV